MRAERQAITIAPEACRVRCADQIRACCGRVDRCTLWGFVAGPQPPTLGAGNEARYAGYESSGNTPNDVDALKG